MVLQEMIRIEVNAERLQQEWTTADLVANRDLAANYEITTLRTDPPNFSVSLPGLGLGDGFHVRTGAKAIYFRVGGRGRALLYSLK